MSHKTNKLHKTSRQKQVIQNARKCYAKYICQQMDYADSALMDLDPNYLGDGNYRVGPIDPALDYEGRNTED